MDASFLATHIILVKIGTVSSPWVKMWCKTFFRLCMFSVCKRTRDGRRDGGWGPFYAMSLMLLSPEILGNIWAVLPMECQSPPPSHRRLESWGTLAFSTTWDSKIILKLPPPVQTAHVCSPQTPAPLAGLWSQRLSNRSKVEIKTHHSLPRYCAWPGSAWVSPTLESP